MSRFAILTIAAVLAAPDAPEAQTFSWAKRMGRNTVDEARAVAADAAGNVYVAGWFEDTVDFDPGTGISNLISAGMSDIFIQKLDAAGNFVWARRIGGPSIDQCHALAFHSSGNLTLTGNFIGNVDFNPGAGADTLRSAGGSADIFLLRLDTAGNFGWAKSVGGTLGDNGYSVAVDSAQSIYLAGYFRNVADFDPDTGIVSRTSSGGSPDAFAAKYGPAGQLIWVNAFGGPQGDEGQDVAVDGAGAVTVTGSFRGTVDFDPDTATAGQTSNGAADIFIARYSSTGAYRWAHKIGGTVDDMGVSLAVDPARNSYTTGVYTGNVDFNPGAATFSLPSSGADAFLLKLDSAGNFGWATRTGGVNDDAGHAVAPEPGGNLYIAGYFTGQVDFDPGTGVFSRTGAGLRDVFVQKLDTSGAFVWAASMGGTGFDEGRAVALDGLGNAITAGWFEGTADFDPDTTVNSLVSAGNHDAFVQKLGVQTVGLRGGKSAVESPRWKRIFGSLLFWKGRARDALGRASD